MNESVGVRLRIRSLVLGREVKESAMIMRLGGQ